MTRLDGMDGAFFAFESPTAHLHVLGTLILEPDPEGPGLDFGRIRTLIADRIHLVPVFRKRMVEVPFGLQQPAIVDDPNFDLDYHVRRMSVPSPGTMAELAVLVADLAGRPMDRARPLWEFTVVEGVENGRTALVAKIHHAIMDGVSGVDVLAAFFDLEAHPPTKPFPLIGHPKTRSRIQAPRRSATEELGTIVVGTNAAWQTALPVPDLYGTEAEPRPAAASRGGGDAHLGPDGAARQSRLAPGSSDKVDVIDPGWIPSPLPNEFDQFRELLGGVPDQVQGVAKAMGQTVRNASRLLSWGRHRGPDGAAGAPQPFEAPRTSINRAISPHRRVTFTELSLDDVRRVRRVLGGTVNDIVLTVAAQAMSDLLAHRDEHPERPLVALVPVSVRTDDERGTLGNKITAMLVSLGQDEAGVVERLRQVRQSAQVAKADGWTLAEGALAGWVEVATPAVATRLSRLATNLRVFDHLNPTSNVIVSNVPGPGFPLYFAGARLVALYPLGPIVEGIGLNITVFSHEGRLFVGIQGCWDLVPDIGVVAEGMVAAMDELVRVAARGTQTVPWRRATGAR